MNKTYSEREQRLYDESNILMQKYLDFMSNIPDWVLYVILILLIVLLIRSFIKASPKAKVKLCLNLIVPLIIIFGFSYLP